MQLPFYTISTEGVLDSQIGNTQLLISCLSQSVGLAIKRVLSPNLNKKPSPWSCSCRLQRPWHTRYPPESSQEEMKYHKTWRAIHIREITMNNSARTDIGKQVLAHTEHQPALHPYFGRGEVKYSFILSTVSSCFLKKLSFTDLKIHTFLYLKITHSHQRALKRCG